MQETGVGAQPPAEPTAADIADGRPRALDPRVVKLRRIGSAITATVLATGSLVTLLIATFAGDLPAPAAIALGALWAAAVLALAWLVYRWPAVAYRHQWYRVDTDGIEIRRGVFWREVINVPRSRIQHTDVAQGPIERRYGLGTLVVYTAGSDHARVSLDGLSHDVALRVREHLLPTGSAGDSGAV
jgi:membrane protein YdbS with pleckstrin-like domain